MCTFFFTFYFISRVAIETPPNVSSPASSRTPLGGGPAPWPAPPAAQRPPQGAGGGEVSQGALLQLTLEEGFDESAARRALTVARNNLALAREILQQFG